MIARKLLSILNALKYGPALDRGLSRSLFSTSLEQLSRTRWESFPETLIISRKTLFAKCPHGCEERFPHMHQRESRPLHRGIATFPQQSHWIVAELCRGSHAASTNALAEETISVERADEQVGLL